MSSIIRERPEDMHVKCQICKQTIQPEEKVALGLCNSCLKSTQPEEFEQFLAICETFGHYDDGDAECSKCEISQQCFEKGVI